MKKKSFLILLPALMMVLASCNETSSSTSSSTPETTDTGSASDSGSDSSSEETKTGTVTIEEVAHGKVTADKMTAKVGETVTFTVTTDENYEVDTFKVNGNDVALTDGKATATMVESGLTVKLTVKQTLYSVTLNETKNGTVTADKTSAVVGDNVTFTVKADEEFEVDTFKVNDKNVSLNDEGKATVAMVKDGLTVDATFKAIKHAVNIDKSITNGTVTTDKTTAANGEVVTFTVTPSDDYELATFKVNGVDVTVSGKTATYTMGKADITVTATFTQIKHKVTIDSKIVNGEVLANKTEAVTGEEVKLTITPDSGFRLEQLTVNDKPVAVTGNTVTVSMVKGGITVSATFTDFVTVSSIDDAFISEVEGKDVAKYKLAGDLTADHLPVAKKTTVIDLNGKTLTVSSNYVLSANDTKEQEINISNGTIKVIGEAGSEHTNFFNVATAKAFTMTGITITNDNEMVETSAVVHCSAVPNVTITDSTIDAKTTYGVSTNNLEGENASIKIVNSKITVTTANKDNSAVIVNVKGANVDVEGSTLTADRHALIARIGTYTVTNSTLKITDEWLKVEANNTKNNAYLDGTRAWGSGNEVPSSPLCAGDTNAALYNDNTTVTLDSVTSVSSLASHIVSRDDGTYTTTLNVDALTYLNTYQKTDISKSVTLNASNVKFLTIKEMNALTTTDAKNLYVVSGNITNINAYYNSSDGFNYANGTLVDEEGNELTVFNAYNAASSSSYSLSNGSFVIDKTTATALDSSYVGKEVTMIGTFEYYSKKSTPEIARAITFVEDVIATVTTNVTGNGTVELSKTTDIHVGEEITVTVTPDAGYKLASVKVTKYGEEYDITKDLAFVAAKITKVDVVFVDESAPVAETITVAFAKNKWTYSTNNYTSTWNNTIDDVALTFANANNNQKAWDLVKFGPKSKTSTGSISTVFADKTIASTSITFKAYKYVTSLKLIIASDSAFKNVIESIDVTGEANKTISTNITTPTAGAYIKYEISIDNTSTSNGCVEVTGLSFTTAV